MEIKTVFTPILILLALILVLSACTAQPAPTETQATPTPDPCTGWTCTLEGVVYLNEAAPGNEIAGTPVDFQHVSNCSPTRGKVQATADQDGRVSFEVFLHDTDSFVFEVNLEGYQSVSVKMGGFDCLYCACDPIEVILQPAE